MVKKLQKLIDRKAAAPAGLLDSQLAQTVRDSAQQIWLAGLGAFAKAQGEGTKVFDTLMKEGLSLHRKTQEAAGARLGEVAGKVSAMAGGAGGSGTQWDKLESIFEERTARALKRLGVPTARDVAALAARVDALTAAVEALGKRGAAARPAGKARPAAKPVKSAAPVAKAAKPVKPRAARKRPAGA